MPLGTTREEGDRLAAAQAQLDGLELLFRATLEGDISDGTQVAAGLAELMALVVLASGKTVKGDVPGAFRHLDEREGWQAILMRAGRLVVEAAGPAVTAPVLCAAWAHQGIYPEMVVQLRAVLNHMEAAVVMLARPTESSTSAGPLSSGLGRAEGTMFDWVTVPAGWFTMGSNPRRDRYARDEEQPQHRVYLPVFRLARTPLTVAQFEVFSRVTGYQTDAETECSEIYWSRPRGPQDHDLPAESDHPVTCVSWHDAQAFCRWAGVRLPTEAEWEKAARETDGRIYPWGDEQPAPERCHFGDVSGRTAPVGSRPAGASRYGLLDMAGNVSEWTSSQWGSLGEPYRRYPYNPRDGREVQEALDSVMRIVRGGCFRDDASRMRCACRDWRYPFYRSDAIGFRVAAVE